MIITAEQRKRIKGFQVVVLNGKELPQHKAIPEGAVRKTNGPHHEAKWAKNLTERYSPAHYVEHTATGKIVNLRFVKVA